MRHIEALMGMTKDVLSEIRELERACCQQQELNMKLNWDMLETRSKDEVNDILCYENGQLVGFLGLYSIGQQSKEVEVTGMVHPAYRRMGVFSQLFAEAVKHCKTRKAEWILLITERSSVEGIAFVNKIGARYACSEYRMRFNREEIPKVPVKGIILRKANREDYKELMCIDHLCFEKEMAEVGADQEIDSYVSAYIIEFEGKSIGKIGIVMDGMDGYIYGFGIKPEHRGKGYGREALSLALHKLRSDQVNTAILEVAVANENALSLYKSCGFTIATIYDYYKMQL